MAVTKRLLNERYRIMRKNDKKIFCQNEDDAVKGQLTFSNGEHFERVGSVCSATSANSFAVGCCKGGQVDVVAATFVQAFEHIFLRGYWDFYVKWYLRNVVDWHHDDEVGGDVAIRHQRGRPGDGDFRLCYSSHLRIRRRGWL
ncbi:unnamed protein product [Protopolystoma xenopodis]|uniref:Uncharacterized protein n=1 Tax=Protopolystoma xenopodis TaxID=117903 RepID=A0A3S5BNQ9_9PLAT|nr:unnamed protein product [Protopolystoma xenopodis]